MDVTEILLNNFRYAVRAFGGTQKLADVTTAGSKKYFDQILSGFQGKADRSPRSLGKKVAEAVARALGHDVVWMYQPHPELWESHEEAPVSLRTGETVPGYSIMPPRWPFDLVQPEDIAALTPTGRAFVEGQLLAAIKQAVDHYGTNTTKTEAA